MNMMDDMKVKVAIITTQEVQIKDFISFNFQWRPLENFDILPKIIIIINVSYICKDHKR